MFIKFIKFIISLFYGVGFFLFFLGNSFLKEILSSKLAIGLFLIKSVIFLFVCVFFFFLNLFTL